MLQNVDNMLQNVTIAACVVSDDHPKDASAGDLSVKRLSRDSQGISACLLFVFYY